MAGVRMMEAAVDEVIDMVAVGQGGMSAIRAVRVTGAVGRAGVRIAFRDFDPAFVEMVAVQAMEAAVVKVVDVAVVPDGGVAAIPAVDMAVVTVDGVVGHAGFRLAESERMTQPGRFGYVG